MEKYKNLKFIIFYEESYLKNIILFYMGYNIMEVY